MKKKFIVTIRSLHVICKMSTNREAILKKHKCKQTIKEEIIKCEDCKIEVNKRHLNAHLKTLFHKKHCIVSLKSNIELIKTAFNKNILTYRIKSNEGSALHVNDFMHTIKPDIIDTIKKELFQRRNSLKVNFELFASYMLPATQSQENDKSEIKSFNSRYNLVTMSTDIEELYSKFLDILKRKSEEFQVMSILYGFLFFLCFFVAFFYI